MGKFIITREWETPICEECGSKAGDGRYITETDDENDEIYQFYLCAKCLKKYGR